MPAVRAEDAIGRYNFHIDGGELGPVMDEIHHLTGLQLLFSHDLVGFEGVNAVNGQYTIEEAMAVLLQDTGLTSGLTESGMVVITRENGANALSREGSVIGKQTKRSLFASVSAFVFGATGSNGAIAQEDGETANDRDTIVVVGSYLEQGEPQNAPSPVTVLNRDDLLAKGDADITRLVFDLPVNQGSEAQPNIFLQNFSAGTAQFNLRGLGLASTLVLFDGKRSVLSAASAQDGSSFVDINSIPKIAIDGIDILKDGAAALYGSDAIAGVVNMRLRKNVEGIELTGSYQSTYGGDQDEWEIGAIGGFEAGAFNFVGAVNYFKRNPLAATDRDFTAGTGYSRAGQPANYILIDPDGPGVGIDIPPEFAPQFGPLTPDPDCEAGGGIVDNIGGPGPTNHCLFDFIQFAQLVIPEERIQAYASVEGDLTDTISVYADFLIARNEVQGQTLPGSLPSTDGIIPPTHPNSPFPVPAVFIGRPFANNAPAGVINRDNDTTRIVAGAKGALSESWNWDLGFQYSKNSYFYNFPDVRIDRLNAAFLGMGGPNNNEYFNPFGAATGNSQAVIDDIAANATRQGDTELFTVDAVLTGELPIALPGGNIQAAIGGQFRNESLKADFDDSTNNFELAYLGGADDFSGERSIYAFFGELSVPITDRLELQVAGRYEDYEGTGSTFDPKVAARFEPIDGITLRGSYSTTFRAPSLLQTNGFQGAVAEIQPGQFRTVLFVNNPDLDNEEADVFNVGAVYESQNGIFSASDEAFLSIDYWNFDYRNVITGINPAQAVNDFLASGDPLVQLTPASVFRDAVQAGFTGVFGRGGPNPAGVVAPFVNAASIETDGLDVEARYSFDVAQATVTLDTTASFVFSYDLTPSAGAATIDGLGQRNFFNFGRSNTDFRLNGGARFDIDRYGLGVRVRHLGGYFDEVGNAPIRAHTEVDLQFNADIPEVGATVTVGATNLFDNAPPFAQTFFGFDTQQHDPRGGIYYLRFTKTFGKN